MLAKFLLVSAFAIAAPISTQAAAPDATERRVQLSEIDWSDGAQVAAVHARLERAARSICSEAAEGAEISRRAMRRCVTATLEGAIEESGQPALAAYEQTRRSEQAR